MNLIYRYVVGVKSIKKKQASSDGETNDGVRSSGTSDINGNHATVCSDSDIKLLMEEAKTMLSIGSYNENIVNLQGITYETDPEQENLTRVCCVYEKSDTY